jgi:hypothetical protein
VTFASSEHVAVSITTVTNLVRHGCRDHSPADPPVGPTVGDLAAALADLAPFRVTSPPEDVTIYGYSGKHLELTVPDLPVGGDPGDLRFIGCVDADLYSWISPPNEGAFNGYTGPRLPRGVLDPRRGRGPSDDRGPPVRRRTAREPPRAAGHSGLHTDRAMTRLAHARCIEGHLHHETRAAGAVAAASTAKERSTT